MVGLSVNAEDQYKPRTRRRAPGGSPIIVESKAGHCRDAGAGSVLPLRQENVP